VTAWGQRTKRKIVCIGVGGTEGWKCRKHDSGLQPDLTRAKDHKCIILFDSNCAFRADLDGHRQGFKAALLRSFKAASVETPNLPHRGNAEINGPDDLLKFFDDAALTEVLFPGPRKPKVWESREFLAQTFPPREPLVVIKGFNTPVFTKQSINQLFAKRGTGKSLLSMAFAGVLSTGGEFLNWQVLRPVRTLYVDGELPNAQIQDRMRELHSPEASIQLVTLDDNPNVPSLATSAGQEWIEGCLGNAEALILDSIASLAPFSTNDEDLWIPFSSWLMRLRSRGLCILLLHQAGKLGLQRGHSRGDDPLDVQIKLEPKVDEEIDHLDCELSYEKFRAQRAGARSLHVEYSNRSWKWSQLEADKMKMLEEYLCLHPSASSRSVAKDLPELGSHITIQKLMKKATV